MRACTELQHSDLRGVAFSDSELRTMLAVLERLVPVDARYAHPRSWVLRQFLRGYLRLELAPVSLRSELAPVGRAERQRLYEPLAFDDEPVEWTGCVRCRPRSEGYLPDASALRMPPSPWSRRTLVCGHCLSVWWGGDGAWRALPPAAFVLVEPALDFDQGLAFLARADYRELRRSGALALAWLRAEDATWRWAGAAQAALPKLLASPPDGGCFAAVVDGLELARLAL